MGKIDKAGAIGQRVRAQIIRLTLSEITDANSKALWKGGAVSENEKKETKKKAVDTFNTYYKNISMDPLLNENSKNLQQIFSTSIEQNKTRSVLQENFLRQTSSSDHKS